MNKNFSKYLLVSVFAMTAQAYAVDEAKPVSAKEEKAEAKYKIDESKIPALKEKLVKVIKAYDKLERIIPKLQKLDKAGKTDKNLVKAGKLFDEVADSLGYTNEKMKGASPEKMEIALKETVEAMKQKGYSAEAEIAQKHTGAMIKGLKKLLKLKKMTEGAGAQLVGELAAVYGAPTDSVEIKTLSEQIVFLENPKGIKEFLEAGRDHLNGVTDTFKLLMKIKKHMRKMYRDTIG